MIENLGKDFLGDSAILDGGCRNFSKISEYRDLGIDNSLIAYTSTGKGAQTKNMVNYFSKFLRENKGKDINITWSSFAEEKVTSEYVKDYVKFPGNILDMILKIESGE